MTSDFYEASILPHAGIIIKICRAYTHTQEDFEDYYQEVCLQIWRSRDRFDGHARWSTWIYRISLNVCLTLFKKKKKRREQQGVLKELPVRAQGEDSFGSDESIQRLYQGIRQLSEIDRAVILLYLEQQSYQEIADILGTKANNIGVRISRIKKRLRRLLDEMEA